MATETRLYTDRVAKGMKKVVFSADGRWFYVEGNKNNWPSFWLTVEKYPPTDETQAKLKTGWIGPDFCRYTKTDRKTKEVVEDYVRAEYYFSFWKVKSYETKHLPSDDILVKDYRDALKLKNKK